MGSVSRGFWREARLGVGAKVKDLSEYCQRDPDVQAAGVALVTGSLQEKPGETQMLQTHFPNQKVADFSPPVAHAPSEGQPKGDGFCSCGSSKFSSVLEFLDFNHFWGLDHFCDK